MPYRRAAYAGRSRAARSTGAIEPAARPTSLAAAQRAIPRRPPSTPHLTPAPCSGGATPQCLRRLQRL